MNKVNFENNLEYRIELSTFILIGQYVWLSSYFNRIPNFFASFQRRKRNLVVSELLSGFGFLYDFFSFDSENVKCFHHARASRY